MIAAGLVCEENGPAEPESRSMGRPAQLLSLNRSAAYAVGADIGHSHVRVALYDLHGSPVWDQAEVKEVDTAPQETLDLAADLIERALRECLVPQSGSSDLARTSRHQSEATVRWWPTESCRAGSASARARSLNGALA